MPKALGESWSQSNGRSSKSKVSKKWSLPQLLGGSGSFGTSALANMVSCTAIVLKIIWNGDVWCLKPSKEVYWLMFYLSAAMYLPWCKSRLGFPWFFESFRYVLMTFYFLWCFLVFVVFPVLFLWDFSCSPDQDKSIRLSLSWVALEEFGALRFEMIGREHELHSSTECISQNAVVSMTKDWHRWIPVVCPIGSSRHVFVCICQLGYDSMGYGCILYLPIRDTAAF